MAPSIKLTYFDIEGRAEPVRLALALSGTPFDDVRVKFPEWQELKPKTPNGQLPIISIDGGPARGQSMAMLRWAGKEFSSTLYPDDKIFDVEEAIGLVQDMTDSFRPAQLMGMRAHIFGYPEGYNKTEEGAALVEKLRKKFVAEDLPKFLTKMEDMIDQNGGQWLASKDAPTIADCFCVPTLRLFTRGIVDHVDRSCLDSNPKIVEYLKRFCALDGVKGRYSDGIH